MDEEWTRAYWEFMMSEDYDAAFSLRDDHFPNTFFKYRGLSQRTIGNIDENYIWLAEIASLNDPFECSLQFDNDESLKLFFADKNFTTLFNKKFGKELTKDEIQSIVTSKEPYVTYSKICKDKNIVLNISPEKQLQMAEERWTQIIEETNKNIKICSFSELNNSLLLWSHYADEHKGICIEYDFIEENEIRPFLLPIVYSNNIYKIKTFEELTTLRKIGSTLIKSKDWGYEEEWRLVKFKQGDEFPNKITVPNPKAIYLGTRFNLNDENLKKQLFEISKKKNIPIFQMIKHPKEYKLIKLLE